MTRSVASALLALLVAGGAIWIVAMRFERDQESRAREAAKPHEVHRDLALDAVIAAEVAETAPLVGSDAGTWSKTGWQQFRWGMGTADVQSRLAGGETIGVVVETGASLMAKQSFGWSVELKQPIYEESVTATFAFNDGLLRMIRIAPRTHELTACRDWVTSVAAGLELRYGKPRIQVPLNKSQHHTLSWRLPGLYIGLNDDTCSSPLVYIDDEFASSDLRRFEEHVAAEAKAKL